MFQTVLILSTQAGGLAGSDMILRFTQVEMWKYFLPINGP